MSGFYKKPFFIMGCVRSGTTFLRDVLRMHPNLVSPEETHFFRWAEPFGTESSLSPLFNNSTLKRHRELDNVSEKEFEWIIRNSVSRSDLYKRYMKRYLVNNNLGRKRWFDKTPQNVYGAPMMLAEFPGSKLVHIVRNPMDVVASLRLGRIVKVENVVGACNYWVEAAEIMSVVKKAYPNRVFEIKYETMLDEFAPTIKQLLEFLGEDYSDSYFSNVSVVEKRYQYSEIFNQRDIDFVKESCGKWARDYGYFSDALADA